ncbi:MAG TPA: hypothetical protein VK589_17250, partial [Chryseolinea sp.]|nr:hypothetical protein [Chryseolinea sp.]
MKVRFFILLISTLGLLANGTVAQQQPLFESLSPQKTGVTFKNILEEGPKSNVLTYEYFYNGGGVSVGDIDR